MKAWVTSLWTWRWVEPVLAAAVVCGLLYCAVYLYQNSYLPPPFFYEPSDTYADWFNTAFWSRDPGTYDVWKSVYLPLSFVFLRAVSISSCYSDRRAYDFSAGLDARDCDWVGLVAIWLIFFVNLYLIWKVFSRHDRSTALSRTICVGLGLPMLDSVERGNLVLLSFTFLLLALAPLLKSARLRWLAAGIAVNFKIYLIAAIIPLVAKRRWRWVEGALISVVLVYLVSFALLGRGSPLEIYNNIRDFAELPSGQILDQWYTTTYQPLLSLISEGVFPLGLLIGSHNVDLVARILPIMQRVVQACVLTALALTMVRPEPVPPYRVINLGILLALITSEAGGYSMVYFMLFTLLESWRGLARRWAIVMCYILALPLDIIVDRAFPMARETYFGDHDTMINYYVTVGPFVRPLMILSIALALSLLTIQVLWREIHRQSEGQRWRLHHDNPLLAWVSRSERPTE